MKYIVLFFIFISFNNCTSTEKKEEFQPSSLALKYVNSISLTDKGIQDAKATWDSIRPLLQVDSTVHGFNYGLMAREDTTIQTWLIFDYDTASYARGPKNLKFQMLIKHPHKVPAAYIYAGNRILPCEGKFQSTGKYSFYSDSVDIITESCISELIKRKGIRIDTDQGPTESLTPTQAKALEQTMNAYKALAVLNNPFNKGEH